MQKQIKQKLKQQQQQQASSGDEDSVDEDEQLLDIGDGQLAAVDDIMEDDIQNDSDSEGEQSGNTVCMQCC